MDHLHTEVVPGCFKCELNEDELAEHDREVRASAIDGFAAEQERSMAHHAYVMDDDDWKEHRAWMRCLRNYASMIRAGER